MLTWPSSTCWLACISFVCREAKSITAEHSRDRTCMDRCGCQATRDANRIATQPTARRFGNQLVRIRDVQRDRFFDEYMDAMRKQVAGHGVVQATGSRDDRSVDLIEQRSVVGKSGNF